MGAPDIRWRRDRSKIWSFTNHGDWGWGRGRKGKSSKSVFMWPLENLVSSNLGSVNPHFWFQNLLHPREGLFPHFHLDFLLPAKFNIAFVPCFWVSSALPLPCSACFYFYFILGNKWFTKLYWFQVYSKVIQYAYTCIHSFSYRLLQTVE